MTGGAVERQYWHVLTSLLPAPASVAFTALSTEGAVQQPPVMSYEMPDDEVEVHVKGAHLAGQDFMAVKMANGGYLNQRC